MFDNYYDKVSYEQKTEEIDKSGFAIYLPPRIIDVRYVSGGNKFDIGAEETAIKYSREYHVPFEIREEDKIDGRLVLSSEPSRDIFGNVCFYRVKVE